MTGRPPDSRPGEPSGAYFCFFCPPGPSSRAPPFPSAETATPPHGPGRVAVPARPKGAACRPERTWSRRRRRVRHASRGAWAAGGAWSLGAAYRAARGRGAQGRGARPKPSNPLTRECRSQSRGQLRAAPTGSPRDARFCLRRPPRSAPHPRTGPAPVRAAPLIGPPRPRSKGHAPILEIPPAARRVGPWDTPRPVRVARRAQD